MITVVKINHNSSRGGYLKGAFKKGVRVMRDKEVKMESEEPPLDKNL